MAKGKAAKKSFDFSKDPYNSAPQNVRAMIQQWHDEHQNGELSDEALEENMSAVRKELIAAVVQQSMRSANGVAEVRAEAPASTLMRQYAASSGEYIGSELLPKVTTKLANIVSGKCSEKYELDVKDELVKKCFSAECKHLWLFMTGDGEENIGIDIAYEPAEDDREGQLLRRSIWCFLCFLLAKILTSKAAANMAKQGKKLADPMGAFYSTLKALTDPSSQHFEAVVSHIQKDAGTVEKSVANKKARKGQQQQPPAGKKTPPLIPKKEKEGE